MNRNNVIYNWQKNRNPFIDQPDLVEYIWGNNVGEEWSNTLNTEQFEDSKILVFPNPASNYIDIKGIEQESDLQIFDVLGNSILKSKILSNRRIYLKDLSSGMYLVKISSNYTAYSQRIIVD